MTQAMPDPIREAVVRPVTSRWTQRRPHGSRRLSGQGWLRGLPALVKTRTLAMPTQPRSARRRAPCLTAGIILLMAGGLLGCTGVMHGTIVGAAGEPIADTPMRLACADRVYETRTDADGRYRFAAPETGACQLQLLTPARNQDLTAAATASVYAFPHRTEYNFTLQRAEAGSTLAPEPRERY